MGDALLRRPDARRRRLRGAAAALLPGVASGEALLTPALREVGTGSRQPATTYADGTVTGRKIGVTYADRAARLLVTATDGDRAVVALVDPHGPGVELLESGSSYGTTQHTVVLDGAPAELLPGADAARVLRDLAVAGLRLTAAGVVAGARDLTATYIKGRTQFGRSLAEFQAVAMQIADVYIASRTLDLAADNAAWRIANGIDVADDLAVAAYWVCHEAPGAMRTCHHLHGGMGVDITYPMHRYFSWVTDIAHALERAGRGRARRGPDDQEPRAHRRAARAQGRAAGVLHRPRRRQRRTATWRSTGTARPTSASCARWATTAGWASAGRRSTAATGSARSSRRSSPTRRSAPTCTCRP